MTDETQPQDDPLAAVLVEVEPGLACLFGENVPEGLEAVYPPLLPNRAATQISTAVGTAVVGVNLAVQSAGAAGAFQGLVKLTPGTARRFLRSQGNSRAMFGENGRSESRSKSFARFSLRRWRAFETVFPAIETVSSAVTCEVELLARFCVGSGRCAADTKYLAEEKIDALATISVPEAGMVGSRSPRLIKRALDIIFASCGLIAMAPFMAATAVAIRITQGKPVLFRQQRPSFKGRPFTIVKFRSMSSATGPDGALLPEAERLTRLGYWMRKTSFDELPELWNVLRGDMSVVGPRPLLMRYLPLYSAEQMRRHDVKPGLTGLAQVRGRHTLEWSERFELDTAYVDNWSLRLDAWIIRETLSVLLKGQASFDTGSGRVPFSWHGNDDKPGSPIHANADEPGGDPVVSTAQLDRAAAPAAVGRVGRGST